MLRASTPRGVAWIAGLALAGWGGQASAAEPKVLHLANRPEFIAADTVQKFEAETGISVTYDLYQSDEAMSSALAAGNPQRWDLVVVSTVPVLAKGVASGWFAPMDTQKLANFGNLDPWVLDHSAASDPGNRYGVPYLWGTAGLGINTARLHAVAADAPLDTLALVFDPAEAAKLAACGVAIEDEPAGIAMTSIHMRARSLGMT